jgi:hypothetical protein
MFWLRWGDAVLASQPALRRVTLTTMPTLASARGGLYARLSGRAKELAYGSGRTWEQMTPDLLAAEWPGIEFTLPPAGVEFHDTGVPLLLTPHTLAGVTHVTPELLADAAVPPPWSLTLRPDPVAAFDVEWARLAAASSAFVPAAEPDPAAAPDLCERCGKAGGTDYFEGYRHGIGEGEWLCDDCHSAATMEE